MAFRFVVGNFSAFETIRNFFAYVIFPIFSILWFFVSWLERY